MREQRAEAIKSLRNIMEDAKSHRTIYRNKAKEAINDDNYRLCERYLKRANYHEDMAKTCREGIKKLQELE